MKQILFVDDKPAIGKVLSVYLGKENELVYFEDPVRACLLYTSDAADD